MNDIVKTETQKVTVTRVRRGKVERVEEILATYDDQVDAVIMGIESRHDTKFRCVVKPFTGIGKSGQ